MGEGFFVLYIAASYALYSHWEGFILFILGVNKHKSGNPGPVILNLTIEYAYLNYYLLFTPISIF